MTIPLKKEPDDFASNIWGCVEGCYFCMSNTHYWHENTNNPVCQKCARKHKVVELPDYGKLIRKAKRKLNKEN